MKTSAFHDALTVGKTLLLLARMADDMRDKSVLKQISRLRSRLDCLVVALSYPTVKNPASVANKAEAHLDALSSDLRDGIKVFRLDALALGKTKAGHGYLKPEAAKSMHQHRAAKYLADVLSGLLAVDVPADVMAMQNLSATELAKTIDKKELNAVRSKRLRAFGSLVRNVDWADALVDLGADIKDGAGLTAMLTAVGEEWGSGPGRASAALRMDEFLGVAPVKPARRRSAKAVAAGWCEAAAVHVTLDVKVLARLPEVRAIPPGYNDVTPTLASLLDAAAQPVLVTGEESAESIGEAKFKTFLAGVAKRAGEVKKAQDKKAKSLEDAEKAKALEALRKLGPLAEVLKKNPGLLAQL